MVVQSRGGGSATTVQLTTITGAVPAYLEVARSGTTFTTYYSTDGGQSWSPIPGSTISLPNLGSSILAGLAVSSHNGGQLSTVTMDSVAIGTSAPPPPGACPAGWTCQDIGNPPAGTQDESGGTCKVRKSGYDAWWHADQLPH